VNRSVAAWKRRCANAARWAADTVLLVRPSSDATTSYRDAWTRSQRVIRERLFTLARELQVIVAVEEVWNKFLLSPLEFARYHRRVRVPVVEGVFRRRQRGVLRYSAGLDSRARTRIAKVHLKDFHLDRPAAASPGPTSGTATSTGSQCGALFDEIREYRRATAPRKFRAATPRT